MRAGMVAFIGLVIAGSSLVTTSSARAQGVSLLPGLSEPAERGPILGRALRPQRVEESEADEDRIETDRDSFTPSTRTVNFGRVVVESSYSYIDNREGRTRHSYPELLTRYGLTDWLELRIGGNYESGDGGGDVSGVE